MEQFELLGSISRSPVLRSCTRRLRVRITSNSDREKQMEKRPTFCPHSRPVASTPFLILILDRCP